jgi:cyclophilin family peptidyl-prolyl cis-trans isomerase
MQRNALALVALGVCFGVAMLACSREEKPSASEPAAVAKPEPPLDRLPTAVLTVRDMGEIRLALRPDVAPITVENFQKLADAHFYDGTTFHRVIPGFMIQGGDPNTKDRDPRNDGMGGPDWRIPDERSGISHLRGVLSMANAGPNTGGSQFFIMVGEMPDLDARHTAFGRVVSGMDVVDRIVAVERDQYGRHGPIDRPLADVVIESLRVEPPQAAP